jgi:serine protease
MKSLVTAGPAFLAIVALLLAAPAGAATKAPSKGPKAGQVKREIDRLATAISHSGALSPQLRKGLAARARSSKGGLNPKNACRAFNRLGGVQNAIVGRAERASGGAAQGLNRLGASVAKVRNDLLLLRPVGKACGGPATFAVDARLKPRSKALPKMGGARRPLARVAGPDGSGADFVENEIVVKAKRGALKGILRHWDGKLLKTADVPGDSADIHLVRIGRGASPAGLASDVGKLSKTRGTSTLVSSEQGLDTLAAVADEAAHGRNVGINWISEGASFVDGSTHDSADGPSGFSVAGPGWSDNAYNWLQLSATGPQSVGVAPSWTLLANLDRLHKSSIRVGILDMGFAPRTNGDMAPDLIARSNVPGFDALGSMNLSSCTAGFSCPWHGTGTENAAMGIPDNGIGAAGPAGPVAQPVLVYTLYDFFTGISATLIAAGEGARVINMSYGAGVPAAFSWTVAPFEATTGLLRAGGTLLFAAAGNESTDVDATDCFIVCWEETLFTPCENAGVICVGATDNGVAPACYSNWGPGDGVDIWGPGTVLVGPDPQGKGSVQAVSGTSVASPFTAGVAALAWAGTPSAGAGDVERALLSHARAGGTLNKNCDGNDVDNHRVDRFVDALATVKDLLPRDVEIRSPTDGATIRRGTSTKFEAFVYDDGLGAPSLSWTLAGASIGTSASFFKSDLPVGVDEVVLTATFPDGSVQTDTAHITVTNDPPSVEIQSPASGASFFKSQTATFRGHSFDVNEPPSFSLADSQVSWYLDGSPTPFATGHEVSQPMSGLSVGSHTVTFRGNDGQATAEASITIEVKENPADLPPTVTINSPTASKHFLVTNMDGGGWYVNVPFDSTASDPEADPLTYSWSDRINNGAPQSLSTTLADPTLKLYWVESNPCNLSQHDVTVTVSDGTSTASDTVRIFIEPGPC